MPTTGHQPMPSPDAMLAVSISTANTSGNLRDANG